MCSWQVGSREGQGEANRQRSPGRELPQATLLLGPTGRRTAGPASLLANSLRASYNPFHLQTPWAVGGPLYSSSAKWAEKPQGATGHTTHNRSEQGEQRPSQTPSPISRVSFPVSSGGASSLTSSPPSSVVVCLHSYHGSRRRGCYSYNPECLLA